MGLVEGMRSTRRIFALIFAIAMMLGCAIAQPQPETAKPLPAIFQKWLDEDVTYIAKPEEKMAFVALKDDEERDEFVRQFWLRRDPTPGTAENEFKEEHYRRIAYSNVHFASKLAGWKTDRGKTYIVMGPPDEITAGKSSLGVPHEIWVYRHAQKTLVFEDPCRCGQYEVVK